MNNFDDDIYQDPFESILGDLFGSRIRRNHKNTIIKNEEEDRTIDYIEGDNYIFLIFDLPGYSENDVEVKIKGNELNVKVKKKSDSIDEENVQPYLSQKLLQGVILKKFLPNFINPTGFKYTMKNGILEIIFRRK